MTAEDDEVERATHRLITRVSDGYERWTYNTVVAAFMEFANELYRYLQSPAGARTATLDEAVDAVLLLLAPMAPHITAELWDRRHPGEHVHAQSWPVADPSKLAWSTVTMVVQVNGKVRDRIEVDAGIDAEEAERLALASSRVRELLDGGSPRKVVARPPKLVNVVA